MNAWAAFIRVFRAIVHNRHCRSKEQRPCHCGKAENGFRGQSKDKAAAKRQNRGDGEEVHFQVRFQQCLDAVLEELQKEVRDHKKQVQFSAALLGVWYQVVLFDNEMSASLNKSEIIVFSADAGMYIP